MSTDLVNKKQGNCCSAVFSDFVFQDIRNAHPPKSKGVYVIRIRSRGLATSEIVALTKQRVVKLQWSMLENNILGRVERIKNIGECPLVYIGSAGTHQNSKHTLFGRYRDFSGRHTAMYPLWALLYFGWELEYGWRIETDSPASLEEDLKQIYKQTHNGRLPALVHR
ncbi:MAG: hypothetical protein IAE79_13665 [Anaerolinea sp.]|nr:hypothetical protein [Anaerolinea sp.]